MGEWGNGDWGNGVKGAFGAALMLPIIHPDGVGKNIRGDNDAINCGNLY